MGRSGRFVGLACARRRDVVAHRTSVSPSSPRKRCNNCPGVARHGSSSTRPRPALAGGAGYRPRRRISEICQACLKIIVALLLIGLLQRLLGELVDLRVAIAADVIASAVALLVAATDDVLENVVALERGRRPTEQVERGIISACCGDAGEELRFGLGKKVDLHADARQHADDRLADRLVIDVAVVRAIHLHLEAFRIAGFGEQFLRGFGIEGDALEVLRIRIE